MNWRASIASIACTLLLLAAKTAGAEQVTLTYMQGWLSPEHIAPEQEIIEEFMRRNPDIKVEMIVMNEPPETIPVAFAAGALGDVVVQSRDDFPNWQSIGMFLDLTPFLERDREFVDQFVPELLSLFQAGGRQFGLLFASTGRGLTYYNADEFANNGIPEPGTEPWTWSELVEHGRKLVRHGSGGELLTAAIRIDSHPMNIWTWFWANDSDLFNADYTASTATDEGVLETFAFIRDLIHSHGIMRPPSQSGSSVIGVGAGPWAFVGWKNRAEEGGYVTKIMWNPYQGDKKYIAMQGGSGLGISAYTKHPEEAWRLLRYLTSEEVQWKRYLEGYGSSSLRSNLIRASQSTEGPIPEPQSLYWDVFNYGLPQPSFPKYRAWLPVFREHADRILEGLVSPEEGMATLKQLTDAMLNEK